MTVTKLAEADKQELVRLYCETDATATSLAAKYGISLSTVTRLLQDLLPSDQYKQLSGLKHGRGRRRRSRVPQPVMQLDLIATEAAVEEGHAAVPRPEFAEGFVAEASDAVGERDDLGNDPLGNDPIDEEDTTARDDRSRDSAPDALDMDATDIEPDLDPELAVEEMVGDEFEDEDDDETDDLDEEEDFEEFEGEGDGDTGDLALEARQAVSILPIAEATFPSTCYMVVDRFYELVTRPLHNFHDLGQVAVENTSAPTVPLFNNHRIARRFATPNQKIVKFPSNLILTAQRKLVQKGIAYVLYDGSVYAL